MGLSPKRYRSAALVEEARYTLRPQCVYARTRTRTHFKLDKSAPFYAAAAFSLEPSRPPSQRRTFRPRNQQTLSHAGKELTATAHVVSTRKFHAVPTRRKCDTAILFSSPYHSITCFFQNIMYNNNIKWRFFEVGELIRVLQLQHTHTHISNG